LEHTTWTTDISGRPKPHANARRRGESRLRSTRNDGHWPAEAAHLPAVAAARGAVAAADLDAAIVKAALAKGWTERRAGNR
jgi:hypothetical protein